MLPLDVTDPMRRWSDDRVDVVKDLVIFHDDLWFNVGRESGNKEHLSLLHTQYLNYKSKCVVR
jgi:hypothetical protein